MLSRFLLFICLLLPIPSLADTADHAGQLAALLADTKSMRAEFSQRVVSDEGELLEESSGQMAFQRPHQLRWEISEPYAYQVLTNGETLWRYDVDFEQLTTEAFESVAQTPMLILAADAAELNAQYQVSQKASAGATRFNLKPRAKDSDFRHLALVFEKRTLVAMELTDNLGQQTDIRLQNTRLNEGKLEASLFVFDEAGIRQ